MSTEFEERVTKRTQVYRALGQGLKTFYEHRYADVDILAVPGLGTNPEECWTWTAINEDTGRSKPSSSTTSDPLEAPRLAAEPRRQFNWLRDSDGLASLFPKSRIMLYDYASAWQGPRKVRATMKSICTWLLDDLKEKRKGGTEITRPLIIIGHSMGGIVIAKTLCIAKARREYETIVTCTMGCAFFGVPFRGSDMAKIALLYSNIFGNEAYESLLSSMRTEPNDILDEVTNDFMEISSKLVPPIDLFCAWEQVPTDVSYYEWAAQKIPNLLQHKFFKAGARKFMEVGIPALGAGTHFVEMESAVLQGAHSVGLTAGHSDLIKFESITSEKFVTVRVALSKMVQMARINARKRTYLSGQKLLTQKFVNQVRQSLEGVDMRPKFHAKVKQRPITSWLTSEPLYQEWLTTGGGADVHHPHLWLKGGPGLGKTNASLVAIQHISQTHLDEQQTDLALSQSITFLAYFLCEWSSGCCTAEDVLKNLITQIINQEESLAQHARWFVPNPRYRGPANDNSKRLDDETSASGAKATATVDNLWKCLQDMIDDPVVDSIHLVISNIHCLDSSDSTTALLSKLRENAFSLESLPLAARRAKWLVTSRNDRHICEHLTAKCISVIDLENDLEYGGKVKVARQKHARDAVLQLRLTKKYSSDLAYYVRNSIEGQSEDEKWIDVLCILLGAMPSNSSNLSVKKWLREVGNYNIHKLVDHTWDTILSRNEDARLEIEELLQALTIAYETPTLADLAVLTQIDDLQRLRELVRRCSPILQSGESGEHKDKVIFASPEFGQRLSTISHGQLDLFSPQKKRYHGLMALRCFKYLKSSYKFTDTQGFSSEVPTSLVRPSTITAQVVDDANVLVLTNEDDEPDDADTAASQASTLNCFYPIKYLFRHLSEGFPDVAQELCEDDPGFWDLESGLRNGWLKDFQTLTTDLKDLNTSGMSALHVAAGIGANQLVSILVSRSGKSALSWTSDDGMTALHVAAFNNHSGVVDTLIRAGADIEAGEGDAGTALHLAALRGNCSIMGLLIDKKANVNALSQKIGPVINAAIRSGTVDAVKQIMGGDVRFDLDYTKCDPPLSLSAGISEPSLFQDILETGKEKWLQNVKLLDQALIAASYSGRLESVRILLKFQHVYTNNTMETAILSAALEKNWTSVNELLDYAINDTAQGNRRDVKLDDAFYLATTSREERLDVLEKIWTFTNHTISQDIRDFSLYQATVLKKNITVVWLLETCEASANATAERPSAMIADYANVASSADFWNALNAAASTGNAILVKSLIHNGAEIDSDRGYALQLAASEGHTKVVEVLLEQGALVDKKVASSEELGFFSSTALQAACDNNRTGVVEALIKHGADPNLGGGVLSNPITAATQTAQPDILRLLLNAPGINVNVTGGEDQSTPLINAATHMSTEFVELLVQKGANINARNSAGDTALIMAARKGEKTCVDMLCNKGADVTYRSPRHGLAIQVAADGLHSHCAHVLAERMGGAIEAYREKVKIDPSKESLNEALAKLKERDKTIESLNAILAETNEQLEIANKDIDFHQLEEKRLLSVTSFHGETYESLGQQIKAMQSERVELLKQLDASRGHVNSANDTITNVRVLLDNERQTNDALRARQGWATLQREKKAALEMVKSQEKAAIEISEREKQKRNELQNEIQVLQNNLQEMKEEITSVRAAEGAATEISKTERQEKEDLQNEMKVLQNKSRGLEEVLASIQAAAGRNRDGTSEPGTAPNGPETPGSQDYFRHRTTRADRDMAIYGLDDITVSPIGSLPIASPSQLGNSAMAPRSPTTSPNSNARSPGWQAESGFRTIHGQHRADGSLGGYRTDRGIRRMTSDSLYNVSIVNGSGEGRSLSMESLHSDVRSTTGSAEAWKAEEVGENVLKEQAKNVEESGRVQWG